LALFGVVPGETAGWGTGKVTFRALVMTAEHQEIYPVCSGQYTAEVSVDTVLDDPMGVLQYVTKLDICYASKLSLTRWSTVEVVGTYSGGACPFAYCGRVEASSVEKLTTWEVPETPEEPNWIKYPTITTDSAEATETTVVLKATLQDDGGEPSKCRFSYKSLDGRWWYTEWKEGVTSWTTLTQKVAGLVPGTRYQYSVEATNSAGWSGGREGTFTTLEEKIPPIANPAVWISEPRQINATSITMVADIERDVSAPEEYAFDFISSPTGGSGGSDSLWQYSPMYTDVGLNPNHQYGYRTKARDSHGNETAFSLERYEYTDIESPEGIAFGQITTASIQAKSSSTPSGLDRGKSGLKLENITTGTLSTWQRDNAFWTSDGLLPNTRYGFRAQARNGDGDLTPLCGETFAYTLAVVPSTVQCSGVTTSEIAASWSSNGNPTGTQYWCQNTVRNANSGWTTSLQWLDSPLSANVKYTYRVKARNGDGVETALAAQISAYSAIETPAGVALGTITTNSIQVKSSTTPSGLDQGDSGLWFENVTTGQASSWRKDSGPWTSDGLLPNRGYGFRVRARNGDSVQTPYSDILYAYTYANPPAAASFAAVAATRIQVQWLANGNPAGTRYLCENTTAGMNSGWTTDTSWDNTGLSPNTSYTYRVKARNAEGVETGWVSLGSQSTDYRTLTIDATTGGQVTSPGAGTFRYAESSTVSLVATPANGYHFLFWTGSAVDAGRVADPNAAQTTARVDAHYTLTANFLRTRIYVDKRATGAKDGSTWTNAYASLQDALEAAQKGNEICISQGTYRPDLGATVQAGDRLVSFELKSGVTLRGGYAGLSPADPNTRDIAAYPTILSGDLKGDDRAVSASFDLYSETSRTENSLHVVVGYDVDNTALTEGVTITGGNGVDGAGVCLIRSHPTFSQCTLQANRAGQLSGDGLVGWGEGAGASCYQSSPVFSKCTFSMNWAGGQGGGLYGVESSPTLTSCRFRGNEASIQGGGVCVEDSNAVWVDCAFHGNTSGDGGAVCIVETSNCRITSCRFFGNGGHDLGGAVFAAGRDLTIANSVFSGNLAMVDGGGLAVTQGSASLANCTFCRNLAEGKQPGWALAVYDSRASLANCILWDPVDPSGAQIAVVNALQTNPVLTVSRCDVLGADAAVVRKGAVTVTWGAGNLNADPVFKNAAGADGTAGTPDDDLHLKAGSPCVDSGDNTAVPLDVDDLNANGNRTERLPLDAGGQPRFVDRVDAPNTGVADAPLYPSIVDMGAYELGGN
jgi:hypothetical protein